MKDKSSAPRGRVVLAHEPSFTLGTLKVTPATRQVETAERSEILEPRVMQVLVALARAGSAIVTRDELIERCWDGRIVTDDAINRPLAQIRQIAADIGEGSFKVETITRVGYRLIAQAPPRSRSARPAILAILALAIIAGAYVALRFVEGSKLAAPPVVAVVAGENSAASRDWARNVLVALGGLEGAAAPSFQLVDEPQQDADLIIEVAGSVQSQHPQASLVLRSARDRALLWSREFQRPASSPTDLQREVVNSAALILRCANDGLTAEQPLRTEEFKLYLGGCWELLGPDASDFDRLASSFLKLTQAAPKFEAAWAGLLYVESEHVRWSSNKFREPLAEHIGQARQVNPHLAEAYLAEAALLPPNDVAGRIRLANEAVERDPSNALVLAQRSYGWTAVGRMTAAVEDGFGAVQLEPLSPALRDVHVYALQWAGQFERARKETDAVARLWPNAAHLWFMRYRSAYHHGDPDEVWALVQNSPSWRDKLLDEELEALLQARRNPTDRNIDIAVEKARAVMRKWGREYPEAHLRDVHTLALFGRTERMFAAMDRLKGRPDLSPILRDGLFKPIFRDFWRDPRSMRVAQQIGVLEYWRTSGNWPDFCYEADHPYACESEAKKLSN